MAEFSDALAPDAQLRAPLFAENAARGLRIQRECRSLNFTLRRAFIAPTLFVLSGVFAAITSAFALPDELDVQMDEINKPGQFSFGVVSNYTASGPRNPSAEGLRPSLHLLQVSPALSYGATRNFQLGLQLFSSVTSHGEARVDGARLELLTLAIRPDDDDDDGPFLGSLIDIGKLPATLSRNSLDAEIKAILGYRLGRWTLATNPEIGFKVSGRGPSQPDLAFKAKAAYRIDQNYSIGIEHYGELGQLRHIGPLNQNSQQTFAVVDFKTREFDFNIGIGRGWNDFSERWVLKTVVSFPLGK